MNFHDFYIYILNKKFVFKYNNFHEFCFYIPTFILIVVLVSNKMPFRRVMLIGHGRSSESCWIIKTKYMKVVVFKKQTSYLGFKYKSHKNSRF